MSHCLIATITVPMEIVSPILSTQNPRQISSTFTNIWEAIDVLFSVQRDSSCGGHVHVTPLGEGNKYTLGELKKIALAVAFYEKAVESILPPSRRQSYYCPPNSQITNRVTSAGCGLRKQLRSGSNNSSMLRVVDQIRTCLTHRELVKFMQADRLWLQVVTQGCRGRNLVHGLRPWCFRKHTKFCHTAVFHRLPHALTACCFGSSSEPTHPLSRYLTCRPCSCQSAADTTHLFVYP
jgi:hypothetical protein